MKYSLQRQTILEDVLSRFDHPTAEMVYESVQKKILNISLGTVYRNLNQLAEHGLVHKISMTRGSDRFDLNLVEHYHMHCTKCDKVFDLSHDSLKEIDQAIEKETGYAILSHDIVFHGICHECQSQEN